MIYRYDGVKIKDGWTHPETGTVYTKANWFDSQSPEQLKAFGVTRHDDPVIPPYDPFYQKPVEDAAGNYTIENLPIDEVKARKLGEILAAYEESMQVIRAGYTESEIASWLKQETEADNWTKDNTAPTPFIDGLSQARAIDKPLLVDKILQKAAMATQYTAAMTGKKQALEDLVKAAKTSDDVVAIGWGA